MSGDKLIVGIYISRASQLCVSSLFHLNHHIPVTPVASLCTYRASSTCERRGCSPPPPTTSAIHPCNGPRVLPQSSMDHQHFINMLNGISNNIGAFTDPLNLVRAFWGVQNAFGASWPFPSPSVDTSRDQTA